MLLICSGVLAAGLSACGQGEPAVGKGSVRVESGMSARVASTDGRVEVAVPGGSVEGNGTLSVLPAEGRGHVRGWRVEMGGGASLNGPAKIKFKTPAAAEGAPPPLVTFAPSPDDRLVPIKAVQLEGGYAVVTTSHFSFWTVTWWSDVLDSARRSMDGLYRADAQGKQPRCKAEADARDDYDVTSDKGNRVMWCLGVEDGVTVLKVTNARGYAVSVETTPGLEFGRQDTNSVGTKIASLIKEAPTRRGNTIHLVDSGGTIAFEARNSERASEQVKVRPSVPGYMFSALGYAVDTVTLVLDRAGLSRSKLAVLEAMDSGACLAGLHDMATGSVDNAMEASRQLEQSLSASLGCGEVAIGDLGLGAIGDLLVKGFLWLSSGIKTALSGFGAAADAALNPKGYAITLKPSGSGIGTPAPGSSGKPAPGADTRAPRPRTSYALADLKPLRTEIEGRRGGCTGGCTGFEAGEAAIGHQVFEKSYIMRLDTRGNVSTATWALDRKCSEFHATVGVSDESIPGTINFWYDADGEESDFVISVGSGDRQEFEANVEGLARLTLHADVQDPTSDYQSVRGVWGDATVTCSANAFPQTD